MKATFSLCLFLVFGGLLPVFGQAPAAPAHPHSLNLQVEPITNGNTVQKSGGTSTTSSNSSIEISVHNFGTVPDTAQVEWYFVAQPSPLDMHKSASDQQFIFDKGSQSVTLAANSETKIPATSREVTATIQRRVQKIGSHATPEFGKATAPKQSGETLSGWIVRVVADGKVIEAKGSKQELEDIAKDNAKLAGMTRS